MSDESYTALAVLVSSAGRADHVPRYEAVHLLINATSEGHAYEEAEQQGRSLETVRRTEDGGLIFWTLLRVLDVAPVHSAPAHQHHDSAWHAHSNA